MLSKNIFLALTNGVVSLAIKKALKSIGILSIFQFFTCEHMVEQVYCYKPPPDLIITETFSRYEMDGFEAANLIWQKYNVPFIFITSLPLSKINSRFYSCNSKIIPMPFDENKLLDIITELLKSPENPDI